MQLASRAVLAESVYFVARSDGGGIIGAAEFRRQPGTLFLNYIAVDPDYRGRRVATALLSAGSGVTGSPSDRFALDVLCDNAPALRWYGRLGLGATASSEFIELAPPSDHDRRGLICIGPAASRPVSRSLRFLAIPACQRERQLLDRTDR